MVLLKISLAALITTVPLMDKKINTRWAAEAVYFFSIFAMMYAQSIGGDGIGRAVNLVLFIMLFSGALSHAWLKENDMKPHWLFICYQSCFIGFYSVAHCQNLIAIYVGFELVSFSMLLTLLLKPSDSIALEGAFKYFIMQSLGSVCLLLSGLWLCQMSETLYIQDILTSVATSNGHPMGPWVIGLFALGMATKMGSAPMNAYVPDAYECAPPVVLVMLGLLPRLTMWVLLYRLLPILQLDINLWVLMCSVFAVSSWMGGHLCALSQTRLMRMMGYASTAQMGWLWLAWSSGNAMFLDVSLNFLCVYALAWSIFVCLISHLSYNGREIWWLDELSGMMQTKFHMWLSSLLVLSMIVMMGLPPLSGFWVKFAILRLSTEIRFIALAVLGIACSVIGAGYYVKVIYHTIVKTHYYGVTLTDVRGVVFCGILGIILLYLTLIPSYILV